MSADDFLDTNILVYSVDRRFPEKRERAAELVAKSVDDRTGCISYQVVQETLNVLTTKLATPPERLQLMMDDVLIPLWQVNATAGLYRDAISLQSQYGFSFYDSLIIAAALEAGSTRLYSEDLQHGQQIQQLTILNPFLPGRQ